MVEYMFGDYAIMLKEMLMDIEAKGDPLSFQDEGESILRHLFSNRLEESIEYGRIEGYDRGYNEGIRLGFDRGYEKGREHGFGEGYDKAIDDIDSLAEEDVEE